MKVGTKSVLFGAHCFFLHPWFVALAWWKLYGFPFDPRLWVAFFVHDLGYIGKPNMDGPEGETHPDLGAEVMHFLFDHISDYGVDSFGRVRRIEGTTWEWYEFTRYHSRYLAKKHGKPFSRLCVADKLSFALTPRWLYLPATRATGELYEYLKNAQKAENEHWKPTGYDAKIWHSALCKYMREWVEAHKGGAADAWTSSNRHTNGVVSER